MWFALLFAQLFADQTESAPFWASPITPVIMMLVVAWFLLIRPAQKQEQQRRAMVAALKKNDKIVNSGGIIGVIESIKDKEDEVVLRGGLRITKSSINRVVSDEPAKDQKEGGGVKV